MGGLVHAVQDVVPDMLCYGLHELGRNGVTDACYRFRKSDMPFSVRMRGFVGWSESSDTLRFSFRQSIAAIIRSTVERA